MQLSCFDHGCIVIIPANRESVLFVQFQMVAVVAFAGGNDSRTIV